MNVVRSLPSERPREADSRPGGFQNDPAPDHIEASGAALREVATHTTMDTSAPGLPLRVTLCHVRHPGRYPFELFAFAPQAVSDDGAIVDPLESGEVIYAVILNLSVSLQREAAIAYLYDIVLRQQPVADVRSGRRQVDELPKLAADADAASAETAGDLLRFGWKAAAAVLQIRAAEAGFRLEVCFRRDPFPQRDDVVRRMPVLRRLYDVNAQARDLVDRSVSAFAGGTSIVSGGLEGARKSIQQALELAGHRQFIGHALRDADVSGNGYLEVGSFAGLPLIRCVRPDDVEVVGDGVYVERRDDERLTLGDGTIHHRGIEQIDSPYGVSALEPLLFALGQTEIAERTREIAQMGLERGDLPEPTRDHLKRLVAVSDALDEQTAQRVEQLTDVAQRFLPGVIPGLYLRGQERFAG